MRYYNHKTTCQYAANKQWCLPFKLTKGICHQLYLICGICNVILIIEYNEISIGPIQQKTIKTTLSTQSSHGIYCAKKSREILQCNDCFDKINTMILICVSIVIESNLFKKLEQEIIEMKCIDIKTQTLSTKQGSLIA